MFFKQSCSKGSLRKKSENRYGVSEKSFREILCLKKNYAIMLGFQCSLKNKLNKLNFLKRQIFYFFRAFNLKN